MEKSEIIDAIRAAAYARDVKVYMDYSGRAMYGTNCIGIVGDLGDLVAVIARVTRDWDSDEEITELNNIRSDSMGQESIYYWPRLETDSGSDEEAEELEEIND